MSYLFELLGFINIDRDRILEQAQAHPSYAGKFMTFGLPGVFGEYISIVTQTFIFGTILYFTLCCSSYFLFFKYKKQEFLPNYHGKLFIFYDIKWSLYNLFFETFLVSVIRLAQPRYSLLYYDVSDYGYAYIPLSIILHLIYDETLTYWAHRWLHTYPDLYIKFHRFHHFSKDVTPFSGFAFHPIDAFLQAIPTFTTCFIFPEHIMVQLIFGFLTTSWAISIHDNVPYIPIKLFLYSTHHTIHHEPGEGQMKNFGKFTTVWDRIMGSYEDPDRINYGWKEQSEHLKWFKWFNEPYERLLPSSKPKSKTK